MVFLVKAETGWDVIDGDETRQLQIDPTLSDLLKLHSTTLE